MIFYDCYGNEKKFDNLKSLNVEPGCCGSVYFCNENEVLKIYHKTCSDNSRLKKCVYDVVKKLNSSHIYKINDLLFDNKIEGFYFDENYLNPISAYTSDYVRPENVDVLTMPTDYTLENMYALRNVISCFSSKGIRVEDVKPKNVILQNDKIVLIDIDCFEKVNVSEQTLDSRNQLDLLKLIQRLFLNCIDNYDFDIDETVQYKQAIDQIFYEFRLVEAQNDFEIINKFFSEYKFPIDAVKKYKK